MKQLFTLALVLSACTADTEAPSSAHASSTFTSASHRMELALAKLGNIAPLAVTVNVNEPCTISGALGMTGTYDSTGDTFDLTAKFTACVESAAEGTLDGSLQWKAQTVGSTTTETWDGTLIGDDGTVSWSCLFDLTVVDDGSDETWSGTICGYDASTL